MRVNRWNGKYCYTDEDDPKPSAQCDKSGFKVMHEDLRQEMTYEGGKLRPTGRLVYKDFCLSPNPALGESPVYNDPEPVENARPEFLPPEVAKVGLPSPPFPINVLELQLAPINLETPPDYWADTNITN